MKQILQNRRYMQYACSFIASLLHVSVITLESWLSPVVPLLTSDNPPFGIRYTEEQISWLVSITFFGSTLGAVIAVPIINTVGRKLTLVVAIFPILAVFVTAVFTTLPIVLIIMRGLGGIGSGICFVVLPIYVGEITEKDIRGKVGVVETISLTLGKMFVLTVGPFLGYVPLTIACCAFPVLFLLCIIIIPESPYYLIKIGKIENAKESLCRLSQNNATFDFIESRLEEIKLSVQLDTENSTGALNLFTKKRYRKALFLVLGCRIILMTCGIFPIQSYLQVIIEESGSKIPPDISSIIYGVMQLPAVLLAAFLIDRIGRKPILIMSASGSAVALFLLGIYFYFKSSLQAFSWFTITNLTLYSVFVGFGIMVIPPVVGSEVLTIDVKSFASSIASVVGSLLGFLVSRYFQPLVMLWGLYTLFWIFATICILGCLFGIFVLPETKRKSFIEIQEMLETSPLFMVPRCCVKKK